MLYRVTVTRNDKIKCVALPFFTAQSLRTPLNEVYTHWGDLCVVVRASTELSAKRSGLRLIQKFLSSCQDRINKNNYKEPNSHD